MIFYLFGFPLSFYFTFCSSELFHFFFPFFSTLRTRDVAKKKSTTQPNRPVMLPHHPRSKSGTKNSAATRMVTLPLSRPRVTMQVRVVTSIRCRMMRVQVAGVPVVLALAVMLSPII